MTYEITAPAIDSVKVSGASAVSGTLSATTSAYISLDGASRMTLTGSSTSLTVHVNGASRFMGESFVATTTTVKADGASKVWVNVTHQLNVEASGASHVYYRGNPQIQSDISGVARVEPIQAQ